MKAFLAIYSIGQLCKKLGVPPHRVEYVIESRGIEPCARAGGARLFDEPALARIAEALREIDALTEGRHHGDA
jgi:DNA-binding transcriptional MerR regulator